MQDTKIELHPTTCSCRGGSWVLMAGTDRSACAGMLGRETETVTLSFADWKSLGKPPNLEEYHHAAARAEGGERREFQRYETSVKVRLSRIPSWRNEAVQSEETTTEVIAKGGALVRSRMAVESGEVLVFELQSYKTRSGIELHGYKTRAEIRYVSTGSSGDGFQRLGLRFLDSLLPEELIPANARALP